MGNTLCQDIVYDKHFFNHLRVKKCLGRPKELCCYAKNLLKKPKKKPLTLVAYVENMGLAEKQPTSGRYSEEGILGLQGRDRRPCYMPLRSRDRFVDLIVSLRNKYPAWGAKKLRQILLNEGHKDLPSLSTFNRILKEDDLISPIDSDKRKAYIRFERATPNELWQMDFKGHFLVPDSECHPLTILDDCSRYAICLKACASENEKLVRSGLEEAFRKYGL